MSESTDMPQLNSLEAGTDKDFPQRLRVIIGAESIASFARRVGVSRSWLHDVLNGRPASLATLSSIADSTGYTLDWLAWGQGMPSRALVGRVAIVSRLIAQIGNDKTLMFSIADAPPVIVDSELFTELKIDAANAGVLAAPDDEMSPTIWAMDDLLIDQSDREPVDGAIYVVSLSGRLTTRRAVQVKQGNWVFVSGDPGKKPAGSMGGAASENLSIGGRVAFIWRKLKQ